MSSNQLKEKLLLVGVCSRCGRVFRGALVAVPVLKDGIEHWLENRFVCDLCLGILEPAQGTWLPSQFFLTFTTSNNAGDS